MSSMYFVIIFLIFAMKDIKASDPEAHMTVEEVAAYHGYPIETYHVHTDDGYILTLHRIPRGRENTDTSNPRKVVIVQHGVVANSGCWIANLPTKNLPYLLAEEGYDVFLPNLRGNNLGIGHVTLTPKTDSFWDFTFNENAEHDLPAIFEKVLTLSGAKKFSYIGHSMGTTVMFIFLSKNPDYDKMTCFHALAPVAQLKHTSSPVIQAMVPFANEIGAIMKSVGAHEFLPNSSATNLFADTICKWKTNIICSNLIFLIMGFDNEQFNATRLPVYLNFYPTGTSTKTMLHFAQIAKCGNFQEYDYGTTKNMEIYDQPTPPLYDLTKITQDVYLYSGPGDWLASPTDVKWLEDNISSVKLHYVVDFHKFNHADFLWAKDVVPLLYQTLIENLKNTSS